MIDLYYYDIYLVFVTLFTIIFSANLNNGTRKNAIDDFAIILEIAIILFIGLRPPYSLFFGDTYNYSKYYGDVFGEPFLSNWEIQDPLFENTLLLFASLRIPISLFFLAIAVGYFGLSLSAIRKLFPTQTGLAFLVWLGAFSTFSYGVNGLRAGLAASFFLFAISRRDKLYILIPAMAASYFIHHSMLVLIVAYVVVLLFKQIRWFFALWLISFILAALNITYFQTLFAGFTDEHGARYLLANSIDSFVTGFRIDFILYSAVPIILGYFQFFGKKATSDTYLFLLRLYLLTNSVWLLCVHASFTNRIAYLSWFMYPIVLLYPFVNENWGNNHTRYIKYVAYGHLGFTLFMHIIYYS